mmetsp:Transcript_8297/g.21335  ORF Transcript_8297/g.21335 Transcript_8297/m.21335 type:complete len:231 (+) Transcript_8297:1693-2385(+)
MPATISGGRSVGTDASRASAPAMRQGHGVVHDPTGYAPFTLTLAPVPSTVLAARNSEGRKSPLVVGEAGAAISPAGVPGRLSTSAASSALVLGGERASCSAACADSRASSTSSSTLADLASVATAWWSGWLPTSQPMPMAAPTPAATPVSIELSESPVSSSARMSTSSRSQIVLVVLSARRDLSLAPRHAISEQKTGVRRPGRSDGGLLRLENASPRLLRSAWRQRSTGG